MNTNKQPNQGTQQAKNTLYLFTSLPQNRPIYKRDLLTVLSEPEGGRVQFGYRRKWVKPELFSESSLGERNALLLFCEKREEKGNFYYLYHPIRGAKIVKPAIQHDFLTLLLELDSFFNFSLMQADVLGQYLSKLQAQIKAAGFAPDPIQTDSSYFVTDSPPMETDSLSNVDKAWTATLEHFKGLEGLKDSTFVRLKEFSQLTSFPEAASVPVCPTYYSDKRAFTVKRGSIYRLVTEVVRAPNASAYQPELGIDPAVASIAGPLVRQEAPSETVEYVVHFRKSFEKEITTLSLSVSSTDSPGGRSSEIEGILTLDPPKGPLITAVVTWVFGLVFLTLGQDLIKGILLSALPTYHVWTENHVLLIASIAKSVGAVLIAVSAFIAFRKLPVKI